MRSPSSHQLATKSSVGSRPSSIAFSMSLNDLDIRFFRVFTGVSTFSAPLRVHPLGFSQSQPFMIFRHKWLAYRTLRLTMTAAETLRDEQFSITSPEGSELTRKKVHKPPV